MEQLRKTDDIVAGVADFKNTFNSIEIFIKLGLYIKLDKSDFHVDSASGR